MESMALYLMLELNGVFLRFLSTLRIDSSSIDDIILFLGSEEKKGLEAERNYPQLQLSSCGAFINWQESSAEAFKIIFHHYGKPRCWFAIPEEKCEDFRKKMAQEISAAISRQDKERNFFITPQRLDKLYPELKISK